MRRKTAHLERKTPNAERRTPNIEWKPSPFRVNEANSEYGASKKLKYDLEDIVKLRGGSCRTHR